MTDKKERESDKNDADLRERKEFPDSHNHVDELLPINWLLQIHSAKIWADSSIVCNWLMNIGSLNCGL